MPRHFTISGINIPPINITLKKFTREDIYGIREKIPVDSMGLPLKKVEIDSEGILIIPEGAINFLHWDTNLSYVPTSEILETTFDGNPLPITPSIYESHVILTQQIPFDEIFRYDIDGSFIIESNENLSYLLQACKNLFQLGQLYRFTYAYYATPHPEDAILIPFEERIIILIGRYAPIIWASPSMNSDELFGDISEDEELEFQEFW